MNIRANLLKLSTLAFAVIFAAVFLPGLAYADSVTITPSPANTILTEGDSGSLTLTVTNNSSESITLLSNDFRLFPPLPGDSADTFSISPTVDGTCGATLDANSFCTQIFDLSTQDNDPAAEDQDFSSIQTLANLNYRFASGESPTASTFLTVTVNDAAPVPEPSSLILLGSGTAVLFGLMRRRLRLF